MANIIMADVQGSGISIDDFFTRAQPSGVVHTNAQKISNSILYGSTVITVVYAPNATLCENYAFSRSAVKALFAPLCMLRQNIAESSDIETAVVGDLSKQNAVFKNATKLSIVDFRVGISGYCFQNCSALKTLIMRDTVIQTLSGTYPFAGSPFASGGSGGTIYIPKALYDHLGDGSALDYKSATNWATYDAYGTITWAQIEGSQYENAYADGTPIS